MKETDILVKGSVMKDSDEKCYLGIFRNNLLSVGSSWYLGGIFMKNYYVVYDMSTVDEKTGEYLQIGLAPRNPVNNIGRQQYDPQWEFYWPLDKSKDYSQDIDGTKNPYDDKRYAERSEMRKNGVRPTTSQIDKLIDIFKNNLMLSIIVLVAAIFLLITLIICCVCMVKKTRKDTYIYKTYSQVAGGVEELVEALDEEKDDKRIN